MAIAISYITNGRSIITATVTAMTINQEHVATNVAPTQNIVVIVWPITDLTSVRLYRIDL